MKMTGLTEDDLAQSTTDDSFRPRCQTLRVCGAGRLPLRLVRSGDIVNACSAIWQTLTTGRFSR